MPILYRSDVRSPEEIFQTGFVPKHIPELFDEKYKNLDTQVLNKFRDKYCPHVTNDHSVKVIYWLHHVLRPGLLPNDAEEEGMPMIQDANPSYVVSLSYNFASTPIFPINNDQSRMYIYAIYLPEEKIPYYKKMHSGYPEEEINSVLTPFDIQNDVAYDLHSLQTESIGYCYGPLRKESVENMAWGLCAYEAFATSIDPINIICATECIRSPVVSVPKMVETLTPEQEFISLFFREPFDRTFTCSDKVLENPKFDTTGDRANVKDGVINNMRLLANKEMHTTPISAGLGGKTFIVPYSLPDPISNSFTPSFNMAVKALAVAAIAYKSTAYLRYKARL